MKKFRFSLETVQNIRATQENRAREEYAQAVRLMEELQERRRQIQEAIGENLERGRKAFGERPHSGFLASLQQTLRDLRISMEVLEPESQKLQASVDEKWELLMKARQKREVMDKLEEKQRSAYEQEEAREEQLAVDELSTQREAAGLAPKI
tara:strand:- start:744 stop:1199 length:456 start_codon:yes stop_codon:yes gene_type:complete